MDSVQQGISNVPESKGDLEELEGICPNSVGGERLEQGCDIPDLQRLNIADSQCPRLHGEAGERGMLSVCSMGREPFSQSSSSGDTQSSDSVVFDLQEKSPEDMDTRGLSSLSDFCSSTDHIAAFQAMVNLKKLDQDSNFDSSGISSYESHANNSGQCFTWEEMGSEGRFVPPTPSSDNSETCSGSKRCKFRRRSFYKKSFHEISCIGEGSFALVFHVKHKLDDCEYAIKCVELAHDVNEEMAVKEAKTLAKFRHTNIIRYYSSWIDVSNSTKVLCIQMELCKQTLEKWFQTENRENFQLQIAQDTSQGLSYIHRENYIHRDLKPANIFFANDNTVKIGDFGLVTSCSRGGSEQFLRSPDTGTPSYMAPEQSEENYNHKVDIYALGLILFELLWKFETVCEKQKEWTGVKSGIFPTGFQTRYPNETKLLTSMLSADPTRRPEADEVQRCFLIVA
ncbi:eukaryotic translation initiation factor 2-alpha kinase 3 [Callorhinchus milii]|uniref:Eukaryotic translation initiation factor 2-alpha kinase 3-like n=1 Tax=Callorhinchus milii TaxID=7868 RepID=V9KT58_CALMI|nr:eukaryotic translation initiation factor 2-alpha kinase 3 [Callorhinchus milii]XP_042188013.1 eukaryotic translation initiation factor 2-alpha kinase 3 [Callorhinchus milii]|eukprot:gi/632983279/ref/XP_007908568.1/ PREDICTED: eukaryotic translation initiation factor 2-alpha kinase 3-like [Callorhinchus milii]